MEYFSGEYCVCVEAFSRHLPVAAGYFVSNQEEFYAEGVKRDGSLRSIRCFDSRARLAARIRKAVEGLSGTKCAGI